ncbi:MAG TPA: cytochrome c [Longimicrobiales bacterium]|nr:cytochrome c [Longimicrobiales bacterium]
MKLLKQPLWQTVIVLAVAYILIKFGIAYIPPLLGARSAPVPASVVLQYMATVLVAVLLYMSADEERWRQFRQPLHELIVRPDRRNARLIVLILVPLLVGWMTYDRVRPRVSAPPALRSIHPAPPNTITFRGEMLNLGTIVNPLRSSGDLATHYEEGKRVYYQNCLPCHGDYLGGRGQWADAFSPVPANFQDQGTIAQLSESFVFWRIAKGGPGLPSEGTPWNSAMPAWEDMLTAEEIWAVILFLYEQTGWQPRVMEAH